MVYVFIKVAVVIGVKIQTLMEIIILKVPQMTERDNVCVRLRKNAIPAAVVLVSVMPTPMLAKMELVVILMVKIVHNYA
tara:strand:+ start:345 stop:581 length:237 start_codon:yes stop_codon:yes gene_type:complete